MLIRRTCIPALTLLGALALSPFSYAGGMEAPERVIDEYTPMHITLNQAEEMHGQKNVHFFDVNPDEIWNQGHIPGATHLNQENWQALLPKDKGAALIFYCMNKLCTASTDAAREAKKLGYAHVYTMPDGIFGWMESGKDLERGKIEEKDFTPGKS
ncbi:molybdopterin biosynthesis protein MoeB [Leminorella richardii]|uniref:Molybdopterin biosynthesis protein MoeB n=1 Tax=Leminorella richardii TaxID=158841 RepID=A0A2X4UKD3_9GAMM|nr:rhodanese-like domain-containing protein [Leminorella richardii]SQI40367.1 molybdopterin biosynthesis protein MoeB [Leminorella richardii]